MSDADVVHASLTRIVERAALGLTLMAPKHSHLTDGEAALLSALALAIHARRAGVTVDEAMNAVRVMDRLLEGCT